MGVGKLRFVFIQVQDGLPVYIVGLFGVLDFFAIPEPYATTALAFAGGLLILGALLRDL